MARRVPPPHSVSRVVCAGAAYCGAWCGGARRVAEGGAGCTDVDASFSFAPAAEALNLSVAYHTQLIAAMRRDARALALALHRADDTSLNEANDMASSDAGGQSHRDADDSVAKPMVMEVTYDELRQAAEDLGQGELPARVRRFVGLGDRLAAPWRSDRSSDAPRVGGLGSAPSSGGATQSPPTGHVLREAAGGVAGGAAAATVKSSPPNPTSAVTNRAQLREWAEKHDAPWRRFVDE